MRPHPGRSRASGPSGGGGRAAPADDRTAVSIEADYATGLVADVEASFPGAAGVGDPTARFSYPDVESAYRAFLAGNRPAVMVN
jgi:hypothetical protein